jgi:signal transduction histidine kinase
VAGTFARRVVDPFVPDDLQVDPETRRVARLVVAAAVTATPIMLALAITRWVMEGATSRIGGIVGLAACLFCIVPFLLKATASLRLGAIVVLTSGVVALAAIAVVDDGLDSEALLWMSLVPVAAALLRGERAVLSWCAITLAAIAVVVGRDLLVAHEAKVVSLCVDTFAAAGAVVFATVLGRSYENDRSEGVRELRKRERRWRALVKALPDALLRIDPAGRIVDAHVPSPFSALPRTSIDIVDTHIATALPGPLSSRIVTLAELARMRRSPSTEETVSLGDLLLHVVVVPLPDDETLAILHDVSALAAAQRERTLSENRAELLATTLRQRDEFLSVASHELRTPLTAMKLLVHRVDRLSGADPAVPASVRETQAKIATQVSRLETLIDELLDVSRIVEHRLHLDVAPVRLDELAREVVSRFEPEAQKARCAIECRFEHASGDWDRSRLDQILSNLISNALKYAPGNPVVVEIRDLGTEAALVVRDQGPGIPPEDQLRIFERFERLPDAGRLWGLGLGLWIVRQLVESMGGRIELASRVGEGAAFTVHLPKHAARG